mmetsp:Transcript_59860/g.177795  ORF Transcript_59860/g.177795 Transcript_59860/m.177795 type:complete len:255 (+) Transcript_59860:290-1054(+)
MAWDLRQGQFTTELQAAGCDQLRTLCLFRCRVRVWASAQLTQVRMLHYDAGSATPHNESSHLRVLLNAAAASLRVLKLRGGEGTVRAPPHIIFAGLTMPYLPSLTRIDIVGRCRGIHTHRILVELAALPRCCPLLHTLKLGRVSTSTLGVADPLINLAPIAGCASLHLLDLRNLPELVDVAPLAGCASLTGLHLSSCTGVTDVAPLAICPSLHSLWLCGLSRLETVAGLDTNGLLSKLCVKGCPLVTDVPVRFR